MKTIILAGGKGSRLESEISDLPKCLRKANKKAMLDYVIANVSFSDEIIIVIGYKKDLVIEHTKKAYTYVMQEEQLGTGHAALCCESALFDYDGDVIVCFGDMPLLKKETYEGIVKKHNTGKYDCTSLTVIVEKGLDLPKFGRIIRDANGEINQVIEDKDCNDAQRKIRELNVGVMVCDSKKMFECLKEISNINAQNEYYLTTLPKIFKEKGYSLGTYSINDMAEVHGVNTQEQLDTAARLLKERE